MDRSRRRTRESYFSHPDLNRVSPTEFIEDILRGETVTRVLLTARGQELTYFRHPYLHTGLRHQDRDQVESFLARRGYQNRACNDGKL